VARNRGIAEAKGSHLFFLDADDLVAPEAFERLAAALEGRPRTVAWMACGRFRADPTILESIVQPHATAFYPTVIDTNLGPPHTWLAPASIVRAVGGFFEPLQFSEDWDIIWRIGLHADALVPLPYVGALYRQHAKSQFATMGIVNRTRGHAAVMARMIPEFLQRPELVQQYGEQLFWGAWAALTRARAQRVPWTELKDLRRQIAILAKLGPDVVTRMRLTTLIRAFGVRISVLLYKATR
jgi:glycosyltransferase involved in cell wall biosynthesis